MVLLVLFNYTIFGSYFVFVVFNQRTKVASILVLVIITERFYALLKHILVLTLVN